MDFLDDIHRATQPLVPGLASGRLEGYALLPGDLTTIRMI
jgi:hypothetical protein